MAKSAVENKKLKDKYPPGLAAPTTNEYQEPTWAITPPTYEYDETATWTVPPTVVEYQETSGWTITPA